MMMRHYIIPATLLLLTLFSCEQTVYFEMEDDPVLVLNAVLVAGEDSTRVQLSQTKSGNDSAPWAVIKGASITLHENGKKVAEAIEKEGDYHFDYPIRPACTYKVTAEHDLYGNAWGETTLPAPFTEVSMDTVTVQEFSRMFCVTRWLDNPDEQNFYWLGYLYPYAFRDNSGKVQYDLDSLILSYYIYTNSTLVDKFNYTFDHSAVIKASYSSYVRVEDSGLSGQWLELSYLFGAPRFPFILSMDKHYDAYVKSIILNAHHAPENDEFPLFYEPEYSYSNIHGGVGIIGSYVRFQRFFGISE